ncbi:hypothetical protein ACWGH8_25085 [Nonomuraea muscovyensis]|uniref:hypothetical protein n=1 Tax=Nonomuraea muscovyensis TaxID=1124761 RepID=UPI003401132D
MHRPLLALLTATAAAGTLLLGTAPAASADPGAPVTASQCTQGGGRVWGPGIFGEYLCIGGRYHYHPINDR